MIADESASRNAPSSRAGILPNGLAAWKIRIGIMEAQRHVLASMPFSARTTSTLRTKGDRLVP